MIFQYTFEQVLSGVKTQTRRLARPDDIHIKDDDYEHQKALGIGAAVTGEGKRGRRVRWAVNTEYAVQPGRTKKAVGRIRITGIRKERLQDITEEDARAEGAIFEYDEDGVLRSSARTDFARLWSGIHTKTGTRWEDNPEVFVLEFELVEADNA